jgi:putative ABC transport system permease protein
MHLMEALRIALHCMRTGRLRTALTMLGIVLSVAMVVTIAAVNASLHNSYNGAFAALTSAVTVSTVAPTAPGGNQPRTLDDGDVSALKNEGNPSVIADVVPIVNGQAGMRRGTRICNANIVGAGSGYLAVGGREVSSGAMFTDEHYQHGAKVVLIGPSLVTVLFDGNANAALNSTVLIGRHNFKIIGLLQATGQQDDIALMPMTTARNLLYGGTHSISAIGVLATSINKVPQAVAQTQSILDSRHFVKKDSQRDFAVNASQSIAAGFITLLSLSAWVAVGVTGIALLIGTLGLANIMLITVTERTHEIGIRKAIGARRGAILRQFLIEAILIAGTGGLIGASLGMGLTWLGQQIIPRISVLYSAPPMQTEAVLVAFGASLGLGLIAGIYPAIRAARLCPMDALRY